MNLALRGIDGQIAHGDTFTTTAIPISKPTSFSPTAVQYLRPGGDRLRDDKRWHFGKPPVGNANFAWVQHIIHRLAPTGIAGFVLANGSM
jgi:type I restriction enzyme M protein